METFYNVLLETSNWDNFDVLSQLTLPMRYVNSESAPYFSIRHCDDMIETMRAANGCGLAKDSIVLLEQVRTIDKQRLKEKMGSLGLETMDMVNHALSVSFGLNETQ